MRYRIYADVKKDELSALETAIEVSRGSFTKAEQDDENFTLIAEFPGDDPAPPAGTNTPWMAVAEAELAAGVREMRSNPRIEEYFATTTYGRHPDSEPWCSAFVNFCVTQAGVEGTNSALALSWLDWGTDPGELVPGCIVVLERGTAGHGHVGFYVDSDNDNSIRLLGGNQGDAVRIASFDKARILGRRVLEAGDNSVSAADTATENGNKPPQSSLQEVLIDALIQVEPKGDDNAVGDRNLANMAFGCLQIRQPVCDDINRKFGSSLRAEQMQGNRALSIDTCKKYLSIWAIERWIGRPVTDEDRARIWNGGPNGYKRASTLNYWAEVKQHL